MAEKPQHSQVDASVFDSVEDCMADMRDGKIVIVTDDENRENEGDMIVAAEKMTPELLNTMVRYARGLVCVPTTSERLTALGIDDMVRLNRDAKGTAFTVTVDAAEGITTGISAADRARTIRLMGTASATASDFVTPGHLNPLRARGGGVLERCGHTEAAVDLAKLAGLFPCAAICEILNDDGTMARLPDLVEFKKRHNMKLMTVASLIEYRLRHDTPVKRAFEKNVMTRYGEFRLVGYVSHDKRVHYALVKGNITSAPTLARVHSENVFGDMFAVSDFPDGAANFGKAMRMIADEGAGAIIYISQPDSGIKVPEGEFVPPNMRDYGTGMLLLRDLGFGKVKLLVSNSSRRIFPEGYGLELSEQIVIN